VRFDWSDPATHPVALDGVERVYLVAPVGVADPISIVGPFLERARSAGVRRVVVLSSSAVEAGDRGLGEIVAAVRDTLPEWEILRPSWFMQNFVGQHPIADAIRAGGEFHTSSGTGRLPFIDARDIGNVAAHLLATPRAHNAEHRLTGPEALSYDDAAAVVAAVTGRPVRHHAVSTGQHIRFLVDAGYDPEFAALLAALDARVRAGAESAVTDAVETLTGRAPRSFPDFVAAQEGARA
jgi:uncharacterized protein YbjT (DUF2867 family)